jgi:hypothetical protein
VLSKFDKMVKNAESAAGSDEGTSWHTLSVAGGQQPSDCCPRAVLRLASSHLPVIFSSLTSALWFYHRLLQFSFSEPSPLLAVCLPHFQSSSLPGLTTRECLVGLVAWRPNQRLRH